MLPRRRFTQGLALAALAGPRAFAQGASGFPNKPVRLIVPAAAGSAADVVARLLGERLSKSGGQPWVIENKPGAGGIIGSDVVAKAPADGYTLLFTANSFIIAPRLYAQVPYDIYRDFTPIGMVATGQDAIFAHPSLNAKSLADLAGAARRTPEGLNYGAPFIGSSAHLIMESLARSANMKLTFIPASGGPQSFTEALAGRVPVVIGAVAAGEGHVKAGRLQALAVVSEERSALLPDVPTLKEAGYPAVNLPLWFGIYGPGKLPPAIVQQINKDMGTVLADAEFAQGLASRGFFARPGTPAKLEAAMRDGEPVFAKAIVEAGVKP
jgi:tripartite-type tricarboxylate transporter receptor subunit TctC